ncbi:MAG: methyltransferase [Candidatus Sulfotelmatobacter sp.]|jgi:protein-S-isoprenylcysteine O-methyltransferase Ste14
MGTTESPLQSAGGSALRVLTKPWVDRVLAAVAMVPFVRSVYLSVSHHNIHMNIPSVLFVASMLVIIGTTLFRKAPVRVTPNPWFWTLAFVATYWGFLTWRMHNGGRQVAPVLIVNIIAVLGTTIVLWGRFSLGRSIGFVPAQRDIVVHGAYRFVRHPIYTGLFLGLLADCLSHGSPRNFLIDGLCVFWFVIKSLVEETFLKNDPAYAAYLRRVRWHWFPGVI